MPKFHINNSGNVGICEALQGNCPFGGPEDHYDSIVSAARAFEKEMENQAFSQMSNTQKNDLYSIAMDGDEAYHTGQSVHSNPHPEGSPEYEVWLDAFNNPSDR